MRKIISLFKRDYEGNRLVMDEIVEGAEWVVKGEGIPTRKYDGTACAIIDGKLYKRYDVKKGRSVPENAIPCEENPNEHTGHWPHWVPVGTGPDNKYFNEAFNRGIDCYGDNLKDGTYELCGEKVQGNPEGFVGHILVPHGKERLDNVPSTFDGIKSYLEGRNIEGIVWHHPDGRMVKIKKKDFGFIGYVPHDGA